jgi:hypothetical protein
MVRSPFISRTRLICVKSQWTRTKLPVVIRWTAARASVSVKSLASRVRPIVDQYGYQP